jgi:hypothetical protein
MRGDQTSSILDVVKAPSLSSKSTSKRSNLMPPMSSK